PQLPHEAERHDVRVQVGILPAAQRGEHLVLGHAQASVSCLGKRQDATAALSTASCSAWNLVGGLPSILVRILPAPSITKVVGYPCVTPNASPVCSSPISWRYGISCSRTNSSISCGDPESITMPITSIPRARFLR